MGIIYLTETEMVSACKSALANYREAFVIGTNCEYDGYVIDTVAFDDGSTLPFGDRCRFAIEQAFIRGHWSVIAISSNLNDEANASALSVVNDQMCEYFRANGDDANVLFNERRFEMKYVLSPDTTPAEDTIAKQEEWFAQLGIEKAPAFTIHLEKSSN